jgi:hypothetical protein
MNVFKKATAISVKRRFFLGINGDEGFNAEQNIEAMKQ